MRYRYKQTGVVVESGGELDSALFAPIEAAIIIDVYNQKAVEDIKTLVSCRMVRRQLGDGSGASAFPMGASQGSVSGGCPVQKAERTLRKGWQGFRGDDERGDRGHLPAAWGGRRDKKLIALSTTGRMI